MKYYLEIPYHLSKFKSRLIEKITVNKIGRNMQIYLTPTQSRNHKFPLVEIGQPERNGRKPRELIYILMQRAGKSLLISVTR